MATTPLDPRVYEVMLPYLDHTHHFGNAASRSHVYGWRAAEAVSLAREQVAGLIQAEPQEIIWTSGATESNNLAIKGAAYFYQRSGRHIITSQTEHKAVLDVCRYLENHGYSVSYLPVKSNGLLDLAKLEAAFQPDTILVSIMHVNNEIGVIEDIAAISEIAHRHGALLHVDAAQSAGKVPIDVNALQVDLLSLSAHKMYGPKGMGALYVRQKPRRVHLEPLIHGGGHERGLRSGTLPTHQIVGMGEACRLAKQDMEQDNQRITQLRDQLWEGIQALGDVHLNGDWQQRVPHNLNVSFAGVDGEILLASLKDIAVSTGSACASARIEASHVLKALGLNQELAHSAIRFSLGRFTTRDDIEYAIQHVQQTIQQLRRMPSLWK